MRPGKLAETTNNKYVANRATKRTADVLGYSTTPPQNVPTDAQKELKEVQRDFLNKHLLQWAPMYLINMKFEARTPLYYDAADMALEFILSDNEYLVSELKA